MGRLWCGVLLGIAEMWEAVRRRVEVSGDDRVWQVTAGSFDSALDYVRERYSDPVVLARRDRARWWPRVTLTVTTGRELEESAPDLADLTEPVVWVQPTTAEPDVDLLPPSLEEIFARQEERRAARRGAAQAAS